jgi:S-DNA-T family DNA segregation ATPase FtsK/SpoIIIE
MATGNNRKENTFKQKATPEAELQEEQPVITEEPKKEEKPKKESAKKSEKPSKNKESKPQKANEKPKKESRIKKIIGILFLCLAVFLGIALISYLVSFFSGHHQEFGYQVFSKNVEIENRTGSLGVFLAQTLIKESFGIGSFFFVYLLTLIGLRLTETTKIKMWSIWKWALFCLVWLPLFFAFIATVAPQCAIFGGAVGLWLNTLLTSYVGNTGIIIILAFLFLVFIVYEFNLTLTYFKRRREKREEEQRRQAALIAEQRIKEQFERENENLTDNGEDIDPDFIDEEEEEENNSNLPPVTAYTKDPSFEITNPTTNSAQPQDNAQPQDKENIIIDPKPKETLPEKDENKAEKVELVIENTPQEETVDKGKNMEHHTIDTPFDPHYELRDYKFPTLDMLNDYGDKKSEIDEEELNANKNKIVETLGNYGIAIEKIKATIGPTVTLYEIVPAAGIRISKIKNLEDDIALSLAALGIRIIAPIPGKGTIGIEVPNSKPETVSMRSVLSSEKFQNTKYALPCAIGKTISNETYVFDLAKMPHILMAGATGQGKSVGLNAIVASLLYCKHP